MPSCGAEGGGDARAREGSAERDDEDVFERAEKRVRA